MSWSVDGLDRLMKKLNEISDEQVIGRAARKGVIEGAKLVQAEAKLNCPVNDGELRNSIRYIANRAGDGAEAKVYTNKPYARFVELGTGPKGQEKHAGISPQVSPHYRQTPWWIHESQIDAATAERYHMVCAKTEKGKFYQSTGQAAQPFLYPALHDNEALVKKKMAEVLTREVIREAMKR